MSGKDELAIPPACAPYGPPVEADSFGPHDGRLLPYVARCLHPRLRKAIEHEDRMAIEKGMELLLRIGTPEEMAMRVGVPGTAERRQARFAVADGTGTPVPLDPVCSAPRDHYDDWCDVDNELACRCVYFRRTFTHKNFSYILPCRVQQKVVTFLYTWIVDWDFLIRDVNAWTAVARCFCSVVRGRRRFTLERPGYSLPWRPLADLVHSLVLKSSRLCHFRFYNHVKKEVSFVLQDLCHCASLHFDADALPGLWEICAPYFSPDGEEAPHALWFFYLLLPINATYDRATGKALPLTERIVRFLLVDARYWQQRSGSWLTISVGVVLKICEKRPGIIDLDRYAEVLFTMILSVIRPPISSVDKPKPLKPSSLFGGRVAPGVSESRFMQTVGSIGDALPRCTTSPLWNHIRRFVSSTSVFLQPCAVDWGTMTNVLMFYTALLEVACRRVNRKIAWLRGTKEDTDEKDTTSREYRWDQDTVDSLVQIITPVLLPALYHGDHNVIKAFALLALLSPKLTQPHVYKYVAAGIRGCPESPQQCCVAFGLLSTTVLPFSECAETREGCRVFLGEILPLVPQWINCSNPTLARSARVLLFAVFTVLNTNEVLVDESEECEFAVSVVEQLFHVAKCDDTEDHDMDILASIIDSLSLSVSRNTYDHCVAKALKEAEGQVKDSQALAVGHLLEPLARRSPDCIVRWATTRLIPSLRSNAATHNEGEIVWCVALLCGCICGAGLAFFPYRYELLGCIQGLLAAITNQKRRNCAARLYTSVFFAFSETKCLSVRSSEDVDVSLDVTTMEGLCDTEDDARSNNNKSSMGLYRPHDMEMVWEEPSEEHVSFLHEVYQLFLSDIMTTIHNIEHVETPSRECSAKGLSAFIPSHLGSSTCPRRANGCDNHEGTCAALAPCHVAWHQESPVSDGPSVEDVVTPHSVLSGAVCWLRTVWSINCELRVQCCTEDENDMTPWYLKDPKAKWSLPFVEPSLLANSVKLTEGVHCLLLEYVVRRVTGGVTKEAVLSTVLQRGRSLLVRGKLPLDVTRANVVDVDTLCHVLGLFFEGLGLNMETGTSDNSPVPFDEGLNCFSLFMVESEKHRRHFPALFWRVRSECFLRSRRQQSTMIAHPQRLGDALSIGYSLLFSPYLGVRRYCTSILRTYLPYLGYEGCRLFFQRHFTVLEDIVSAAKSGSNFYCDDNGVMLRNERGGRGGFVASQSQECGAGSDESCDVEKQVSDEVTPQDAFSAGECSSVESPREQSDAYGVATASANVVENVTSSTGHGRLCPAQLRKALTSAVTQTVKGFSLDLYRREPSFIRRAFEIQIKIPENLRPRGFANTERDDRGAQLCNPCLTEPQAVVSLVDDLLPLAVKCSYAAPTFAIQMLRTLSSNYIRSDGGLLSPASVVLLFRLAVDVCQQTRRAALNLLSAVLYSLKKRTSKVNILMRRSNMEDEGNVNFFKNRYKMLQSSVFLPALKGKTGLIFPPKSIRIDDGCSPPNMVADNEVLTVPDDQVVGLRSLTRPNITSDEEGGIKHQGKARVELEALICRLAGIWDTTRNVLEVTEGEQSALGIVGERIGTGGELTEEGIRETWIWKVLLANREQQSFSVVLAHMWRSLGEATDIEGAIKRYLQIAQLWFDDYLKLVQCEDGESKECSQELPCVVDLLVAAVCLSKRRPEFRRKALGCYVKLLSQICGNALMSHTVLRSFVLGIGSLYGKVSADEVWSIYASLFDILSVSDGTTCTISHTALNQHSQYGTRPVGNVAFTGVNRSTLGALYVITKLLDTFAADVNIVLLPKLCQNVLDKKSVFLFSDSNEVRQHAATSVRYLLRLCMYQSKYIPSNNSVQSDILNFVRQMNGLVGLQTWFSLAPLTSMQVSQGAASETASAGVCSETTIIQPKPFLLWNECSDSGVNTSMDLQRNGLMTLTSVWRNPPTELFGEMFVEAITVVVVALDINVNENNDFEKVALSTLSSFAFSRQRKEVVQSSVKFVCDILEEKYPFGRTRRAKVILTHALYQMLLMNLHRIGKFETMRNVFNASAACMSPGDGDLRHKARSLLAVLSRVASTEQVGSLIHHCIKELQQCSRSPPGVNHGFTELSLACVEEGGTQRRRRAALVLCLCAFLSADVGPVTPHIKLLMRRLVPFERDTTVGVQREVKAAFEQWWKAHANGWELYHREFFTTDDIEMIMPLMRAPKYLV